MLFAAHRLRKVDVQLQSSVEELLTQDLMIKLHALTLLWGLSYMQSLLDFIKDIPLNKITNAIPQITVQCVCWIWQNSIIRLVVLATMWTTKKLLSEPISHRSFPFLVILACRGMTP